MQERAPSRIYFVHFAYLASFLRLASPDSIADFFLVAESILVSCFLTMPTGSFTER